MISSQIIPGGEGAFTYCLSGYAIDFDIDYLMDRYGLHIVCRLVVSQGDFIRTHLLASRVVVEENASTSPERGAVATVGTRGARGARRAVRIWGKVIVRSEDVAEYGGGCNNRNNESEW